jgi:alpha-tubulin suppressor-like RCC1 family protein
VVQLDTSSALWAHTMFVDTHGRAWAFGFNQNGQLGLGDTMGRTSPQQISSPTGVVQVATGSAHSLLLDENGFVWATGANSYGQLGLGDVIHRHLPEQLDAPTQIAQVKAGSAFSMFVDADGQAWATGANQQGSLGIGLEYSGWLINTVPDELSPVEVPYPTHVVNILRGSWGNQALQSHL